MLVFEVIEDLTLMSSCLVHLVFVFGAWTGYSALECDVLDIARIWTQTFVSLGKLEKGALHLVERRETCQIVCSYSRCTVLYFDFRGPESLSVANGTHLNFSLQSLLGVLPISRRKVPPEMSIRASILEEALCVANRRIWAPVRSLT